MQSVGGDLFGPGSRALILQPHYDDAALSCGGVAAKVARLGGADLVTVFASELVPGMVGEFAAWKHERWRLPDPDAVVDTRRGEDVRAAAALGCRLRWLGLPDAIYRGDNYRSDAELFGPLHEDDRELAEHLALEIPGLPECSPGMTVLVPMGIGSHVDHQLVFDAGLLLAREGFRVLAYEDVPYVIHTPAGLDARLGQVGHRLGEPIIVPIADELEPKIEAIACYGSQLPVIFRFTSDYPETMRRFAAERGGALGPAERLWPVLA